MKNKLLLTTALASLALTGFASAETKITGSMDITYMATTNDKTALNSGDSWGKETQINISKSGDLNNGMKYAAGFSLEFDGSPSSGKTTDISNENQYIDFIMGGTTLSLSQDHGLHTDSSAVPRVSVAINDAGVGPISKVIYRQGAKVGDGTADVKEGMGAFIAQKFDGGTIQLRRIRHAQATADGTAVVADNGQSTSNEGGATDAIFVGNLGVKGLTVNLQYAEIDKAANSSLSASRNGKSTAMSAAYNFGKVAIGAERNVRELATTTNTERKTTSAGITFAASDQLSVGIELAKTDDNSLSSNEKVRGVQMGYNLGGVALQAGYYQVDNTAGTAGNDQDHILLKASAAF